MWKDFDRLRGELERLFDMGVPVGNIRGVARGTFPAVNVGETGDDVIIYVFAPGMDPGKIELTIEKNLLTVTADRDTEQELGSSPKPQRYHRRERFSGNFRRVINLPEGVDPNKVDAKYINGILVVTVGKRAEEKARKIEVAVG